VASSGFKVPVEFSPRAAVSQAIYCYNCVEAGFNADPANNASIERTAVASRVSCGLLTAATVWLILEGISEPQVAFHAGCAPRRAARPAQTVFHHWSANRGHIFGGRRSLATSGGVASHVNGVPEDGRECVGIADQQAICLHGSRILAGGTVPQRSAQIRPLRHDSLPAVYFCSLYSRPYSATQNGAIMFGQGTGDRRGACGFRAKHTDSPLQTNARTGGP